MTDQHSTRALIPTDKKSPLRYNSRRERPVLSCLSCHVRKVKCDRRLPCQTCIKRRQAHRCEYDTSTNGSNSQQEDEAISDNEDDSSLASMLVKYLGASVFSTVNTAEHTVSASQEYSEALAPIILSLPSRREVELLLQVYFIEVNWQYEVISHILFMEAYNDFWFRMETGLVQGTPWAVAGDVAFVALLQIVLAVTLQLFPHSQTVDSQALSQTLYEASQRAAQMNSCISAAESIEMIQFKHMCIVYLKHQGSMGTTQSTELLVSAIRAAQYLGLHHDPVAEGSDAENDRVYLQHELRRRIWYKFVMDDRMFSMIKSAPPLIAAKSFTTRLPRNINDKEPRKLLSDNDSTGVLLLITKARMSNLLVPILEAGPAVPYSKIIETNAKITKFQKSLPECYKNDSSQLELARHLMHGLLQNITFILNQPYLKREQSRMACVNAATWAVQTQKSVRRLLEGNPQNRFMIPYYVYDPAVTLLVIVMVDPIAPDVETIKKTIQEATLILRQYPDKLAMDKLALVERLWEHVNSERGGSPAMLMPFGLGAYIPGSNRRT